jgi:predicted O-methyltransferase YrrM
MGMTATLNDRHVAPPMRRDIKALALAAKGFLAEAEGLLLYELAYRASADGPCVEIGSYCGKSALFLGDGCRARGRYRLFSVDHHGGSEEQQPGQPYFDPDLLDAAQGRVNTLPRFVNTVARAGLEDWIVPVVGRSGTVAASWPGAGLALVFIDGGHSTEAVRTDFRGWASLVKPGGWLCFHDIYPNPADGGRAPFEVFEQARASRAWRYEGLVGSLGVLRRRRLLASLGADPTSG